MNKEVLKARLLEAEKMLTVAEEDLTTAMSALQAKPRSNKTIVSEAVQNAFTKLRAARADVAELVKQLSEDEADA
jgi:RNA polymerase-interacting CarD/CdnL/TRCF family regulator